MCIRDRDSTSEKMAEILNADYLVILTAVDKVSIHYGKPDQIDLGHVTILSLIHI